jgi:epoxyqueuosine reductase
MNMPTPTPDPQLDYAALSKQIKRWGQELGFQQVGITDTQLDDDEAFLLQWLASGHHGSMDYMARHGTRRSRPAELVPGTVRVISVRMDYWPGDARDADVVLQDTALAYLSRYALGRDYHKVIRKRLQQLANKIESQAGPFGYRAFTDSAPVLEKALAQKAGLGWIGKHTNLIMCISYLTIELRDAIPVQLRPLIGNRVYGCDDCQLVCPWNRFSSPGNESDFNTRHGLDASDLIRLFAWQESDFEENTRGSAIHRIGYECWLRNIAVGLGNAPTTPAVVAALRDRQSHPSELVREHVEWALRQHPE